MRSCRTFDADITSWRLKSPPTGDWPSHPGVSLGDLIPSRGRAFFLPSADPTQQCQGQRWHAARQPDATEPQARHVEHRGLIRPCLLLTASPRRLGSISYKHGEARERRCVDMGAAPDERLKDSTEIQGNILAGFNKPHQLFLFLNFKHKQKGARGWLRRLTGDQRIATTKDVAAHNREYRDLRKEFGARRLRQE